MLSIGPARSEYADNLIYWQLTVYIFTIQLIGALAPLARYIFGRAVYFRARIRAKRGNVRRKDCNFRGLLFRERQLRGLGKVIGMNYNS